MMLAKEHKPAIKKEHVADSGNASSEDEALRDCMLKPY